MRRTYRPLLTTGEAKDLLGNSSQQTIIRSFDQGLLKGTHVPDSKFRRIDATSLYRLMRSLGMGSRWLSAADPRFRVLIIGHPESEEERELSIRLSQLEGIRLRIRGSYSNDRDLLRILSWRPDAIAIFSLSPEVVKSGIELTRLTSIGEDLPILYYAPSPLRVDEQEFIRAGATDILNGRTTIEKLAEKIKTLAKEWMAAGKKKSPGKRAKRETKSK
jgi:hypothetical protein